MWPSSNSFFFLLIGLLPLIYEIFKIRLYGFAELTTLRFVFILINWIGFQLTPWFAFLGLGDFDSLAIKEHVDEGVLFSTFSSIFFLVGYKSHITRTGKNLSEIIKQLLNVNSFIFFILMFSSLVCVLIIVGGPSSLIYSPHPRFFKYDSVDGMFQNLYQVIILFQTFLNILLATVSSFLIINSKYQKNSFQFIKGLCGLTVSSLYFIWWFSRGAGFAFILCSFLIIFMTGWRHKLSICFFLLFGLYLSYVGISHRSDVNPGIGNFVIASFDSSPNVSTSILPSTLEKTSFQNPLDGLGSFTVSASRKESDDSSFDDLLLKFLIHLNPIPSTFIPVISVGGDLAEYLGVQDSLGFTTASSGEIYYVFGYFGVIFFYFLAKIFSWFELNHLKHKKLASLFCVLICAMAIPIGIHNNARALTRPLLYGWLISMAFCRKPEVKSSKLNKTKL